MVVNLETQPASPIAIEGPTSLQPIFVSMDATEALSRCFEYTIDVLTPILSVNAEREGIHYYLRHEADTHTLVLVDTSVVHGSFLDYAHADFDFEKANAPLLSRTKRVTVHGERIRLNCPDLRASPSAALSPAGPQGVRERESAG